MCTIPVQQLSNLSSPSSELQHPTIFKSVLAPETHLTGIWEQQRLKVRREVVEEPQSRAGGSIPEAMTRGLSSLHDVRELHQQQTRELKPPNLLGRVCMGAALQPSFTEHRLDRAELIQDQTARRPPQQCSSSWAPSAIVISRFVSQQSSLTLPYQTMREACRYSNVLR